MELLAFLILFPLAIAGLILVVPHPKIRGWVVRFGALSIAVASVAFAFANLGRGSLLVSFENVWAERLVMASEAALGLFLLNRSIVLKRGGIWIPLLILAQLACVFFIEFSGRAPHVEYAFSVDSLSVLMVLVIGVIGTLIAVYAVSYMADYHRHHPKLKDDRGLFFACMFLFLSGMFGIVLANHMGWLYFFWEITTLCSFLLIGYTRNEESLNNAFLALWMNLLGGLAFALALVYMTICPEPTMELNQLIARGSAFTLLPAALLCFAGLTKSAQLPFSSWLLGAMVAPTPVSALLHSSTMVKAGVFLILRFAPVVKGTPVGFFLALVGGVTFLLASLAAVTQSESKRVLAYSTVANLGLIVACAGVGTPEAFWAAVFLLLFHAVSKGLLFLGVGAVEHRIGSRNIEDMDGLLARQPGLAVVLLVGILGMFLAPFGMLISKWVTLQALVDASPLLAVLVAFGSGPTLFFWAKWMGKIISMPAGEPKAGAKTPLDEWMALWPLAVMTVAACALFPLISMTVVEPYLFSLYGATVRFEAADLVIMMIMLGLMILLPAGFYFLPDRSKRVEPYLAGVQAGGGASFQGSLETREVTLRNHYLQGFVHEGKIMKTGVWLSIAILVVFFLEVSL